MRRNGRSGRFRPAGSLHVRRARLVCAARGWVGECLCCWDCLSGDRGALAVLILVYDGLLKTTLAGPIAMGGCRLLNVLLGASGAALASWESPQIGIAVAMGVYVAGITWFARREAVTSTRSQLVGTAIVIHCGILLLLVALLFASESSSIWPAWLLCFSCLIVAFIEYRLAPAIREPTPSNVQGGVKQMLLAIVLLDATMVYGASGNAVIAIATALLIVPAATLGRFIFIT